jgi:hypothetical protein
MTIQFQFIHPKQKARREGRAFLIAMDRNA